MEVNFAKKNKISLADYDYHQDIQNRILLSQFNRLDLQVLEEILYSPISFPIERIKKNLNLSDKQLEPILKKFEGTGLIRITKETIEVEKEMRKYFEFQVLKFEDNFIPDLDFLQGMLKKVPIHALLSWYSIPRSSDNIFQSLIDKYFLTPQTFQRYLMELNLGDPLLSDIVRDVFNDKDLKIPSSELMKKYQISKERFEEAMLLLEFNFLCCLAYDPSDDRWIEVVTPFREWREYLQFLKETKPPPVAKSPKLIRKRPSDFAFVIDMGYILKAILNEPMNLKDLEGFIKLCEGLPQDRSSEEYVKQIIAKLTLVKLAAPANKLFFPLEGAKQFLSLPNENRALFLYRHPHNKIISNGLSERPLREIEKAIIRVLNAGWVYWDDFIRGTIVPLSDDTKVRLKKQGRSWRYSIPKYSETETSLIKATIFEWLFEAGVIVAGTQDEKLCFSVTPFGQNLFAE